MKKGIKVIRDGRSIEVSTFDKAHFVVFIPAIGDELKFYNPYLEMNSYGKVTEVKGQTVTMSSRYKFTLRKSGEWIEKGFQLCDKNRRLIKD